MRKAHAMKRRPGPAGFTLIEVLIALFIFAIGMLAVAKMQGESIRGNTFSDLMTVGKTLAEAKMEDLMNMAATNSALQDNNINNNTGLLGALDVTGIAGNGQWDGHCDDGNGDGIPDLLNRQGSTAGQGPFMFTRMWNVASNTPATGFTTMVVIVQWQDQRGNHRVYASSIRQ
jgi:type IV pilus assembly protein PilV